MGERHIPSAASACSPPLQTLREAGGSWARIWGAGSLGSPQALRQGWAERAELVPTPLLSRLGNTTGLPNLAIPTRISSRCTILDGSQIPLSRCGNSLPC